MLERVVNATMMDVFKSFGSKLFGKTTKTAAKKGAEKALTTAATKTGDYVGKKACDKIVKMLSNGRVVPPSPAKKVAFNENVEIIPKKKRKITDQ